MSRPTQSCFLSLPSSSSRSVIRSSRCIALSRGYATKEEKKKAEQKVKQRENSKAGSYVDPRFAPPPEDAKIDAIRGALYPADSYNPRSSSPVGAHHPRVVERIESVIHNEEVYETIERAWKLYRRHQSERQQAILDAKFKAMGEACDELYRITHPAEPLPDGKDGNEGDESRGRYDRSIYDSAMKRPDPLSGPRLPDRRATPEQRWLAARMEGMIPREQWVAVDSRGTGWKYDWKRPSGSLTGQQK